MTRRCRKIAFHWRQNEIDLLTQYKNENNTLLCKICGTGFNEKENTSNSCKYHTGKFVFHANRYECCGKTKDIECCKICYHVETIETKIKLLFDNK